ncbi:hypothetical protein KMZ30_07255 [Phycicoccus sp. KQZ13P-1]|uniref:hypothetical protein n=1 Tax=Phycicoccus mangrovi TaxID=2840470 RepID=UPI001BFFF412|nr:hypothetical protein [Phycicoccus mangrovi]MBT9255368.1 hypothetical protein [Phycicoccus mangrovi]
MTDTTPAPEPFRFEVRVTATGEVRDADGALISSTPVEAVLHLTEQELDELGIPHPVHPDHAHEE